MIAPFRVPTIFQSLYPSLVWKIPTVEKTIYLTFDDGPHPEITAWVLETLGKFHAKGTFFCVGENVDRYPEMYANILTAGHTAGNHTQNHLKGWNTDNLEYLKNVRIASEKIQSSLFRPPYGRIRRKQIAYLQASGFKTVMWSLLSCDYLPNLNRAKALQALCRYSGPGDIVVFHDSEKASENVKSILPEYLEFMTKQGYLFKAL